MALPKRILVVDDNAPVRCLLQQLLAELGHTALLAADGAEALRLLAEGPDLVLLDVEMPGIDGFEVARRIRAGDRFADVPIVMVTGLSGREERLRAVEAGANDFIAKPVELLELRVRTASLLHMQEARQAAQRYQEHLETMVAQRTAELADARDRALAGSRAKSAFLSLMSRELLTPLDRILRECETADRTPPVQRIDVAASRLYNLVLDVLDFADVEAERRGLEVEELEARALVDELAAAAAPLAELRRNRLEVSAAPGLGRLRTDRGKLKRAVMHLLDNAAKFTQRGCITLSAARESEAGGDWLRLAVADTGIGMTPEQSRRAFEEFWQADPAMARDYGGIGLGLAIVRHFTGLLGGTIAVETAPGAGSTFTLRIPASAPTP